MEDRSLPVPRLLFVPVLAFALLLSPVLASAPDRGSQPAPPAAAQEKSSYEHIQQLLRNGAWSDAETEARRFLAQVEASQGSDALAVARVLDLLVETLWRGKKARDPESRALAERAVSIKERQLGKDHPDLAISLKNLGNVCFLADDLDAAAANFRRMIAISEAALGPDDPAVAKGLNNLAGVAQRKGDYSEALSLMKRSLSIAQARLPLDDLSLIEPLNNIGTLEGRMGHPFEARDYIQRALEISQKHLPPDHPGQAPIMSNLAVTLRELGDYENAIKLYGQVLEIRRKNYGEESEIVAETYQNLAESQRRLGELAAARASLERGFEIRQKLVGPDDPNLAETLTNLALTLTEMGDYASALPRQERALELIEKSLGSEHPEVGQTLQGLAHTQQRLGDSAKAEATCRKAIAVSEKAVGPDHPTVAAGLNLLASIKEDSGELAAANPLYERALAIYTKAYGREHPDVAEVLDHLGHLVLMQGDYAGARRNLEEALEIQENFLGPDHPAVGATLTDLAQLHLATGEASRSLEESLRAEGIYREHFRSTVRYLSEREALDYEAMGLSGLDVAISVLTGMSPSSSPDAAVERVWNEVLRSRAMVLDEMAARHHPHSGDSQEVTALRQSLVQAKRRVASLAVQGPDPRHPEAYRNHLSEIRSESERQERLLADKSASYNGELLRDSVSVPQLRELLAEDTALVAYVRYERLFPPRVVDGKPGPPPKPIASYGVFVLRAGQDDPGYIPLGSGAEIEKLVREWRSEVSHAPAGGPAVPSSAESRATNAGSRLRQAVWDPLARKLRGVRTVLLVPEGALNLVSFSVLPQVHAGYLIESGPLVHYLSAERDLRAAADPLPRTAEIFLLGGPDYDASPGPSDASVASARPVSDSPVDHPSSGSSTYRSPGSSCAELRSLRFDPLPLAAAEVADLDSVFQAGGDRAAPPRSVHELTGAAASESAFKARAPVSRIVHLATHGFFMEEACKPSSSAAPADNLLLLSGLALAGANRRNEVANCGDCEDGILTGEEIASLDLSGVEWVVLSACESGVGKVMAGEGVLGLRRAFQVAGARTLIMSLWKVEDRATREWMRHLYESRVAGLSTLEAVRNASLAVLRARRARGQSTHPFYWGAFVAAGDWR